MSDYYKLTDADGYTRRGKSGETRWAVGLTVTPTGEGTAACGPGVLHLYRHPLEAQLFNPIHGDYCEPRLWRVQTDALAKTDGLKYWTTGAVQVVEELPRPLVPTTRLVAWAILIAKTFPQPQAWIAWADRWLEGADRSSAAAGAVVLQSRDVLRAAEAEAVARAEATWAAAASAAAWAAAEVADEAAGGANLTVRAAVAVWVAWVAARSAAAREAAREAAPDWIALWDQAGQYVEEQP
jgi:hypothetical protein